VRRHGQDGNPAGRTGKGADAPRRRKAIKDRHLQVHQHEIMLPTGRSPDRLLAVSRHLDLDPGLPEQ
jgi:hypothetical protein